MNHPIFLPMQLWLLLGDFLNAHEDLARLLGIMPNAFVGFITEDELVFGLGDRFNIWPERLREAYLAASATNRQ